MTEHIYANEKYGNAAADCINKTSPVQAIYQLNEHSPALV